MATTITTTTLTILSSPVAANLPLLSIVTLLILLTKRVLISGATGERAQRLALALNAAILPLLAVFVVTVLTRVAGTP